MQPRESGGGAGQTATREEKVKTIVDDIMEKMPELFNMSDIMNKVEERTPYVIVCFQVILNTQLFKHLKNKLQDNLIIGM